MNNGTYYPMPILKMTVITGFIGGVLASLFGYFFHYINFSEISPGIILAPLNAGWKSGWIELLVAVVFYGVLSILAALLYYAFFRKKKSFWWGAVYGLVIFLVIFLVLHPLFPGVKVLTKYDLNTILTGLCTFILYGVFIGYSISYEYEEAQLLKQLKLKQ